MSIFDLNPFYCFLGAVVAISYLVGIALVESPILLFIKFIRRNWSVNRLSVYISLALLSFLLVFPTVFIDYFLFTISDKKGLSGNNINYSTVYRVKSNAPSFEFETHLFGLVDAPYGAEKIGINTQYGLDIFKVESSIKSTSKLDIHYYNYESIVDSGQIVIPSTNIVRQSLHVFQHGFERVPKFDYTENNLGKFNFVKVSYNKSNNGHGDGYIPIEFLEPIKFLGTIPACKEYLYNYFLSFNYLFNLILLTATGTALSLAFAKFLPSNVSNKLFQFRGAYFFGLDIFIGMNSGIIMMPFIIRVDLAIATIVGDIVVTAIINKTEILGSTDFAKDILEVS